MVPVIKRCKKNHCVINVLEPICSSSKGFFRYSHLLDIIKLWEKIHVLEAVNSNKRKVLKKNKHDEAQSSNKKMVALVEDVEGRKWRPWEGVHSSTRVHGTNLPFPKKIILNSSVLKTLQKACFGRLPVQLNTTSVHNVYMSQFFHDVCTIIKHTKVVESICKSKPIKLYIDRNVQLGNGCFTNFYEGILITMYKTCYQQ